MFQALKDEDLIETYKQAIELKLDKEFILLLEEALKKRGLLVTKGVNWEEQN